MTGLLDNIRLRMDNKDIPERLLAAIWHAGKTLQTWSNVTLRITEASAHGSSWLASATIAASARTFSKASACTTMGTINASPTERTLLMFPPVGAPFRTRSIGHSRAWDQPMCVEEAPQTCQHATPHPFTAQWTGKPRPRDCKPYITDGVQTIFVEDLVAVPDYEFFEEPDNQD